MIIPHTPLLYICFMKTSLAENPKWIKMNHRKKLKLIHKEMQRHGFDDLSALNSLLSPLGLCAYHHSELDALLRSKITNRELKFLKNIAARFNGKKFFIFDILEAITFLKRPTQIRLRNVA